MAGCGEGCGDDEKNADVERTRVAVETDINALAIGNNTMARSKRREEEFMIYRTMAVVGLGG